MARILTCGFEENNLLETIFAASSGAPTVVTSPVASGTYALRINPSAAQEWVRYDSEVFTSGTLYYKFRYRVASYPLALTRLLLNTNGINILSCMLQISSAGAIRIDTASGGSATSSDGVLATNTWHVIQIEHVIHDTTGSVTVFVDGTQVVQVTGTDTLATDVRRHYFGNNTNDTIEAYYDDIVINDSSGSAFNTMPSQVSRIAYAEADGDSSVAFTKAGSAPASTNWEGVDELPGTPNDDTDYNVDSGTSNVDRLTVGSLPAEVDTGATMICLDLYGRVGSNATTARTMIFQIWDNGGTSSDGPSINVAINGWKILAGGEHFAVSLSGKSKANTEAYDVGYKGNTGGGREKRVTALWANVEWEAPPVGRVFVLAGLGGGLAAVSRGLAG